MNLYLKYKNITNKLIFNFSIIKIKKNNMGQDATKSKNQLKKERKIK